jgi:putative ABC transport system permease protein
MAAAYWTAKWAGRPLLIQPQSVVPAVAFSGLVGVFFGWYPAMRASRLDPIEALRHT